MAGFIQAVADATLRLEFSEHFAQDQCAPGAGA
jgi:hypothetical protein